MFHKTKTEEKRDLVSAKERKGVSRRRHLSGEKESCERKCNSKAILCCYLVLDRKRTL